MCIKSQGDVSTQMLAFSYNPKPKVTISPSRFNNSPFTLCASTINSSCECSAVAVSRYVRNSPDIDC